MNKSQVEKQMESARSLGNGEMEIFVGFNTSEEVEWAIAWMKGKQKVKNLEVGLKHTTCFDVEGRETK